MPDFRDWLGPQTRRRPSTLGLLALDVTQRDHCMPPALREPFQHLYVLTHICQVHGADDVFIGAFLRAVKEWSQVPGGSGGQAGAGFGHSPNIPSPMGDMPKVAPACPPSASSQVRGDLG